MLLELKNSAEGMKPTYIVTAKSILLLSAIHMIIIKSQYDDRKLTEYYQLEVDKNYMDY